MANSNNYPSYLSCVAEILSRSTTPITIDALMAEVGRLRPLGKGARSAVYQAISRLYQAIPVSPGEYGWLSFLLQNQRFRHPLNSIEVQRGYLLLDELEHAAFFPQFFQNHESRGRTLSIELLGGPTIPAEASIERGTWSLRLGVPFVEWVDALGGGAYDDLLIRVEDAVAGRYRLRLQPREARQEDVIRERNLTLARLAESLVHMDRKAREAVPAWELAALLIGQTFYTDPVPPDDMHYVLHEYSALYLQDDMGYVLVDESTPLQKRRSSGRSTSLFPRSDSGDLPPWEESDNLVSKQWRYEATDEFEDEESSRDMADLTFNFEEEFDEEEFDGDFEDFLDDLARESIHEFSDIGSDLCEGYQIYLSEFNESNALGEPLSHSDFHLLEAELEMLVSLEQEFGYLMPDQEQRKLELAERLFIDPNYLYGTDWDKPDYDDPPFWEN